MIVYIYMHVYDTNEHVILRGIEVYNTNIYILVNSVINHANYLQLQLYNIKYCTSHSYYHSRYHTTYIYYYYYYYYQI